MVRWRNEIVAEEIKEGEGEPTRVLVSKVLLVPDNEIDDDTAAAVAQIYQGPNGIRVRLHNKHAALVSIGKHLGMFTDHFKVDAVYGISEEPMTAEEWKAQFCKGQ